MKSLICVVALVFLASAFPQSHSAPTALVRQTSRGRTIGTATGDDASFGISNTHAKQTAPLAAQPEPVHQAPLAAQPAPAPRQPTPVRTAAVQPAKPAGPTLPPNFFGPGLNNPRAFPPNPQHLQAAKDVVRSNPNVRVRVLANGEIEFTNEFGQEIEIVDNFGRDPLQTLDPEEQFELELEQELEQRKRQFELQQRRQEIERQKELLDQLSQQLGQANPAPASGASTNRFRVRA